MRRASSSFTLALAAVAAPPGVVAQTPTPNQQIVAHTVEVSSRQATLGLELADGSEVRISLGRGALVINGEEAGRYTVGGPLENSWRSLLDEAASLSTTGLKAKMASWNVAGLSDPDAETKRHVDQAFLGLPGVSPGALRADADRVRLVRRLPVGEDISQRVAERVSEAVAAGQAARAARDAAGIPGQASGGISTVSNNVAGLIGMFVALSCIAFGLVSFAPRQFEAVTDMLQRSFIRSFFAGLFAQPLLLPVLGMMIVGLVLTIVGVIVVPVAIIAFVLAVAGGLVGGYVALARAFGEILLKRRGVDGNFAAGTTPYKASVVGLVGLLAIWAPFVLLSWVPGINWILLWCAIVFSWIMATAGFGATILSRGGLRHSFVRAEIPGFSGEYSWTGEVAAARSAMKELE